MVDCFRRYRLAMFIDVHNYVLSIYGHILDVSDNLDIRGLSSGMVVAGSDYAYVRAKNHKQKELEKYHEVVLQQAVEAM